MLHAAVLALAVASPAADQAVIVNSGSTNTAGYRLRISADGSAYLNQANLPLHRQISPQLVARFFNELHQTGGVASLPDAHCMKSASFGTTTRIEYRGQTSPDISCPANSTLERALYVDAQAIANAAGVSMLPGNGGSGVPGR